MLRIYGVALVMLLVSHSACGGVARVAGYVDELEHCSQSSSDTGETGSAGSSGTGDDVGSSGDGTSTTTSSGTTDAASTGSSGDGSGTTGIASTTGGSTGEPMAQCGNGVLEQFGPEPEECDDGNLDPQDGCDASCAADVRVFVTSIRYQAGELGGLYLADAICANRADDAGLAEPLTYKAWLSDSQTDARDRFTRGRGRLVMVNGLVLAASWSALLAGALENNFEVTEKSETYHGAVWTGTRPDGTAVPGAQHCLDWTTTSFTKTGHYGYSDRTTPEWTLSALDDNPIGCPSSNALYCLQSL